MILHSRNLFLLTCKMLKGFKNIVTYFKRIYKLFLVSELQVAENKSITENYRQYRSIIEDSEGIT